MVKSILLLPECVLEREAEIHCKCEMSPPPDANCMFKYKTYQDVKIVQAKSISPLSSSSVHYSATHTDCGMYIVSL